MLVKEVYMADIIKRIEYYYTTTSDRPGSGARILNALKAGRVSLLAFTGFPNNGSAQLDFVPKNARTFLSAARKARVKLVGPKTAFLVQGQDKTGSVADVISKLAKAHINITAIDAVTGGRNRYGAIIWVKPRNVAAAAKVLKAK